MAATVTPTAVNADFPSGTPGQTQSTQVNVSGLGGNVTDTGTLTVTVDGVTVAEVPVSASHPADPPVVAGTLSGFATGAFTVTIGAFADVGPYFQGVLDVQVA